MALRTSKLLGMLAAAAYAPGALAVDDDADTLRGSIYGGFQLDDDALDMVSVMAIAQSASDAEDDRTAIDEAPSAAKRRDVGETVVAAVRAALGHSPQIDIAESRRDSARADRFQAFGQFLPEIEASASYADDKWRSETLQTLQDRDGTTLGVTAVQPIFQGLAAINRFREARAKLSQQELSLLAARQQTALDAARAHAGVILGRRVVAHRIENLTLVQRQLEVADKRQQAGAQSRTGVEQARMRLAQAQVDLGAARASLAEREAAYVRITGRQAPAEFSSDETDRTGEISSLDEALTLAREFNPALNAAEASWRAAKHAKNAAIGDFAPRLTLEGSYFRRVGEEQAIAGQNRDEEYQLVARMRMPIFRQGRNIAGLKSAGANVSAEQAQMVTTRLGVDETVMRNWRQLAEAETKRIAARQGIDAAGQSVKGLQVEYEAGQRSVIDVLDGQRDLVQAQINLSQSEFDVRIAQYELAAATGFILEAFGLSSD
ncbi:TolC family protein [Hyphococcus sp.]|uniref:TolC family protein n=1 Tax=Hyphococcus sp. TaxID=2038636 RepID=UPI003CCBE20F